MNKRKYFLDSDLQYKPTKLTIKQKLLNVLLFLIAFLIVGSSYNFIYNKVDGSPKEKILTDKLEEVKLNYMILNKRFDNSSKILDQLHSLENNTYRAILDMDTLPEAFFNSGYGGIDEYQDFTSFDNYKLITSSLDRMRLIKQRTMVEYESYNTLKDAIDEWVRELEYLPLISPVNIEIRRGDGIKFRERHPILGRPAWHHGQDFSAPYGTEVYATGAGKITYVGKDKGYGNFIIIQHGYGYESLYGHLSEFKIKTGDYVKRGDLIGLTGSTGYSTGPHLHYQINLYGKYQNPLYFFNDDLTDEEYDQMIDTLNSLFKF
jgi:murein DD-endopeptidase MepM/ murein hydrolase activator NlpD